MKNILIMVPCNQKTMETLKSKFGQYCQFHFAYNNEQDIEKYIAQAEIIIGEPSREQLNMAKEAKWIQLTWAGADKYIKMTDLPETLCITNARGAFGKIISEYIVGNIIALYRGFSKYGESQRERRWEPKNTNTTIFGKEVLILGTGDIGQNTAKRLKAFDAKIVGIRRTGACNEIEHFDKIYSLESLDELLPKADVVIGCMPSTKETEGLLDYHKLSIMKQDAILINVGRGSLIKTEDLITILQDGHLKGVALDVFEKEPLDINSPLWTIENVIITPHIAGPSFGGNEDVEKAIWDICMNNLSLYLDGKMLENVVDFKKGY